MIRDLIMGGAIVAALDTDTAETCDVELSEEAEIHLDVGILQACESADVDVSTLDLSGLLAISEFSVNNGRHPMVRGTGSILSPNFFDPMRLSPKPVGFGNQRLSASETLDFSLLIEGTSLSGVAAAAFRCRPAAQRTYDYKRPAQPAIVQASPVQQIAAGGSEDLTITFDDNGLADLRSLFLRAVPDAGTNMKSLEGALSALFITQIKDQASKPYVIGKNTPAVGAAAFREGRPFDFFDLGTNPVNSGQTHIVTVTNQSAVAIKVSAGVRFWEKSGIKGGLEACKCR